MLKDRLWTRADPRECYDAILFVRQTSAAQHYTDTLYQTEFIREYPPGPEHFVNLDYSDGTMGWRAAQGPLAYQVCVATNEGTRGMEISRSETLWPHDVFALSQTASAAPWRGKRIILRCAVSMRANHDGASAQLGLRVLMAPPLHSDPFKPSGQKWKWERGVTSDAQMRQLVIETTIDPAAEALLLGLVMTGDGHARFGPITIEVVSS